MDSLYETKWYLNLIEFYEFGSNDTSNSMVTGVYEVNHITFSEQLIFGSGTSSPDQLNDDLQYDYYHLISYNGNRKYANLYTFDTKRDFRKRNHGPDYDLIIKPQELLLMSSEKTSRNPLSGVHESRIYYFSRVRDSLQISSTILGSWKIVNQLKSMDFDSIDTLTLHKTSYLDEKDPTAYLVFQIQYGDRKFYHNLEIPEIKKNNRGYAPDLYYVYHNRQETFPYSIDLENQLLLLHGNFGSYTFRIININETEMVLVRQ